VISGSWKFDSDALRGVALEHDNFFTARLAPCALLETVPSEASRDRDLE
jgi:hypothetical protein